MFVVVNMCYGTCNRLKNKIYVEFCVLLCVVLRIVAVPSAKEQGCVVVTNQAYFAANVWGHTGHIPLN